LPGEVISAVGKEAAMREGQKQELARSLRWQPTRAEALLWQRLRARSLLGHKFRRQHPVGPYVVDLVCLDRGLVIEIDGGQHDRPAEEQSARTAYLRASGFRILRFWNSEVSDNLEGVLEAVSTALSEDN
jgi:very-short-patch-repair endonuclease